MWEQLLGPLIPYLPWLPVTSVGFNDTMHFYLESLKPCLNYASNLYTTKLFSPYLLVSSVLYKLTSIWLPVLKSHHDSWWLQRELFCVFPLTNGEVTIDCVSRRGRLGWTGNNVQKSTAIDNNPTGGGRTRRVEYGKRVMADELHHILTTWNDLLKPNMWQLIEVRWEWDFFCQGLPRKMRDQFNWYIYKRWQYHS